MLVGIKFLAFMIASLVLLKFAVGAIERQLLYHPGSERVAPYEMGLANISEKEILAPDGAKILTWWGRAQPNHFTLLYFHGNAGSLSSRADRIRAFMEKGYGVVMMTYRGYSGRSGSPSETLNILDGQVVYQAIRNAGIPVSQIILYGESLGTGVALQLAAQEPVAGIILDAPYTSMVELAELHYAWLPSRWLMKDRYESYKFAPKIRVPLLIVHGEADQIVPVSMGRRVASLANGPTQISTFLGAGHSDHYQFGSFEVIVRWLKDRTST